MATTASFPRFVEAAKKRPPRIALILGSGMGDVVHRFDDALQIAFHEIPGLTEPTTIGHSGVVTFGDWAGRRVLVFQGRLHFYEGHSWETATHAVTLAHSLGAETLLVTNAAGGIHPDLGPGCLMAIRDHLEWTRPFCWRTAGPGGVGATRLSPYSARVRRCFHDVASEMKEPLIDGIYANLTGPCYETPAEIRALKAWGADAVGMSTAREIQTGFDLGMECGAISLITNRAAGLSGDKLDHEEVLAVAKHSAARLIGLLERLMTKLDTPVADFTSPPHTRLEMP